MFIYLIVNHDTGKYYIGQHKGKNLNKYLQQKFSHAQKGISERSYLFASMRKHPDPKVWSIHALRSDIQTKVELDETEKDFIKFLKAQDPEYGYNICRGGEGFTGPHDPSFRINHSRIMKDMWGQPEFRGKMLEALKKTPEQEAYRLEEHRKALERLGGSFQTPESIEKIKVWRAQQNESERLAVWRDWYKENGAEHRKRAAATHRGKKHEMSAEGSEAISQAFKRGNKKRWDSPSHNIIGKTFNRLTVQSAAGVNYRGLRQWNCLCKCGGHKVATTTCLRSGNVRSCGCLARESSVANLQR